MTLSLDLDHPQGLELFPLIFAYNHLTNEIARAVREGDSGYISTLQTPQRALRQELERRGVLRTFLKLKGLEMRELLARTEEIEEEDDERKLN